MIFARLKDAITGKVPWKARRSPQWPGVRALWLEFNPFCAVCGGTAKVEVHHKLPFNFYPETELDPANLITLCESKKRGVNCHLLFGHLGDYRKSNVDVVADTALWSVKLKLCKTP